MATVARKRRSRPSPAARRRSAAKGSATGGKYLGEFTATSYGPPWGGIQGEGIATACGVKINGGSPIAYGVAAGINLPCGTVLEIQPNPFSSERGKFVVWDRGGAIGFRNIDFYDWRGRDAQEGWGRKTVKVWQVGKINLPTDPDQVNPAIGSVTPVGVTAGDIVLDKAGDIGNPIADLVALIRELLQTLFSPEFWLRVGKGLLGAVALLAGLLVLSRAALGTDLGAGGAVKRRSAERRKDASYRRETARQAEREGARQRARSDAKTEGEERRAQRFFDRLDAQRDDPVPF